MPHQVFSVFATPHFLSRVSLVIISLCGPGFSMIPRSIQRSFVSWSLVWTQKNFLLNLRVFINLSLKLFWSEWPIDLCQSGGRWWGEVSPPHLVMPITIEPSTTTTTSLFALYLITYICIKREKILFLYLKAWS